MKYFLSFQKRKGLYITDGNEDNQDLVAQLNFELMRYGYMLSQDCLTKLATNNHEQLDAIFTDLIENIKRVIPGGGHEVHYKGFPNSQISSLIATETTLATISFMVHGNWNPVDEVSINKNLPMGTEGDYITINSITKEQFDTIFYDIIYSNNSISSFDKEIIGWYTSNGYNVSLSNIKFAEVRAFVGQKLMDNIETISLGTNNATDVLRIWSAYSGGDEGLKDNTKFKQPKNAQKRILLNTLEGCWDLEDVFKTKREQWLRMLYYLNPLTANNIAKYPKVASYVDKLRNEPKELITFNARIEKGIFDKDEAIFGLLKRRMGVFSRRLDHLVRVFGEMAIEKWLENKPRANQLIDIYNHFTTRLSGGKRTAILAGAGSSEGVQYSQLAPLKASLVDNVHLLTKSALKEVLGGKLGKIYIDPVLYYRPIASNNRASSLSLTDTPIGTVESLDLSKIIRAYVVWSTRDDMDLSGLVIYQDNSTIKVGWNSRHSLEDAIIYSGDNTGNYSKNAEYLDINIAASTQPIEYIIVENRIYSGKESFKAYNGGIFMGYMELDPKLAGHPDKQWYPNNVSKAISLNSNTNNAYLCAIHVPTSKIIYLNISIAGTNVSDASDAYKMRTFLDKYLSNSSSFSVEWNTLNQGHILNLAAEEVVEKEEDADVVFDENTTSESVSKYI